MNCFSLFTAASAHSFTDVESRYEDAVNFLHEIEVINGLSVTKFGTQQTLTCGDVTVILAKMLMFNTLNAPDADFKDVNTRLKRSVNALAEFGVVSGVTKTEFKPGEPIAASFVYSAALLSTTAE